MAPKGWLCFNDADLVLQAVLDGAGIAQMAGYQICEHSARRPAGGLPDAARAGRPRPLPVLPEPSPDAVRMRVFIDYMTEQIRALDLHCLVDLLPAAA
jgi:DNA-binding transcriptional LysR family regulator